jgi:hypothetical protein
MNIDKYIKRLRDGYDTYPDYAFDATKAFADEWLNGHHGHAYGGAIDVSHMDDDESEPVITSTLQSYLLGYTAGIDSDYVHDDTMIDGEVDSLPPDMAATIRSFESRAGDVLPTRVINRAVVHTLMTIDSLDAPHDAEDDASYAEIIRDVIESSIWTFANAFVTGQRVLGTDDCPPVRQNKEVTDALVAAGVLQAIDEMSRTLEDDDEESDDESHGETITSVTIADKRTGDTHDMLVPTSMAQKGTFMYDSRSGRIVYTFNVKDEPDFVIDDCHGNPIMREIAIYILQRHGIIDGAMGHDELGYVEGLIDKAMASDDGLMVHGVNVMSCVSVIDAIIEPTRQYVMEGILPRSGVGIYDQSFVDEATLMATAFVIAYIDAHGMCVMHVLNEMDDELPYDLPQDTVTTMMTDEVQEWGNRHRVSTWMVMAGIRYAADNHATAMDTNNDDDDDMTKDVTDNPRAYMALAIGFIQGVIDAEDDEEANGDKRKQTRTTGTQG